LQKSNTILNTKLQKPNLPDDYIHREQLIEYLNRDLKRALTLISAGAGYGKSSFASSWLDSISYKSCWFSIDKSDNDIRTFLSYFIVAIQTQIPDFGKTIYNSIFSPNIASLDILTNNLINDLNSLNEDIFIVFDDFQNITNLEITNLISNILKYPPKNFHFVIVSRIDPALPLVKLRAENKMKDIRSSHLRLSADEIKEFIKTDFKENKLDIITSLLNEKFEGWPTGIRLIKIHLSLTYINIKDLEYFLQNNNLSEIYFIDELIKYLDRDMYQFLLQTSILNKFNTDIANYIISSEKKNTGNILQDLLKKNLFLINLDNTNQWFRYHHLFQDALQKEFKKTYSQQDIIKIHKKAALWFLENSFFDEAFYHIVQTDNIDEIANFIRQNLYIPLNLNKWFILEKWLKYLPDQIINKCPVLLTVQMWIMHHKGEYWIIPELISKVEEIKDNSLELYNSIKHQLIFFKAIINFWTANIKESEKQFAYVKQKMAFDKLGALSLSTIYFATASQLMGNGKKVYKEIQIEISRNNLPLDYKIILLASLLYIKFLEGDLYVAEQLVEQIKKLSSSLNNDFYVAWHEFFMGYISFMQYKTADAIDHFNNALKYVYLLNTHGPIDVFAGALLILKSLNKKEFEQVNNKLSSFILEWNNPSYNTIAYSLKTRLYILDNNLQKAHEEYKKLDLNYNTETIIFNIEVPKITYCKLLLAENSIKKTDEALNKLTRFYNYVNETNNTPHKIDVLILLAVAYNQKNNLTSAIDKLTKAIVFAEPGHIIYPFIEAKQSIKTLFSEIRSKDNNIQKFISILIEKISNKKEILLNNSLSNRELDIINLLAQRLSNQEIADKLFISTSTVKRHTINIYQKLGVNKRREAVEKAIKIGIINS